MTALAAPLVVSPAPASRVGRRRSVDWDLAMKARALGLSEVQIARVVRCSPSMAHYILARSREAQVEQAA